MGEPTRMINVMTVHWQSAKWIDIQLDYLRRNIAVPYRVFASLNDIDDPSAPARFHFAADLQGTHAEKLNELADIAMAQSDDSDVLMFLDGDAFPIRPLHPWISEALGANRLAAVRRDENLGDIQPHPCFCITTVGFWRQIGGDWRPGHPWVNANGVKCNDVGATLLHQLNEAGIEWLPLLRTNTRNPFPVWFGVYDHRVYHHGAGFRKRRSRVDANRRSMLKNPERPSVGMLRLAVKRSPRKVLEVRPHHIRMAGNAVRTSLAMHQEVRNVKRLNLYEERLFARLAHDPDFYREFDDTA